MSFDAVLIVAFGGPQGRADVRPFLANVLRGRRVPPSRVEEVAHHYELFDGVSPLTALTMKQAELLRSRLDANAGCRCRFMSGCATGIPSSPTRSPRCRAPVCAARSDSWPPRSAAIRAARSIARMSTRLARRSQRGRPRRRRGRLRRRLAHASRIRRRERRAHLLMRCGSFLRCSRSRAARLHRAQYSGIDGRALSVSTSARRDGDGGRRASQGQAGVARRVGAGISEPQRPAGGSLAWA